MGTLTDKVYNSLKNSIIELKLKPGEPLIVEEISEKLGASRTPIRTALNMLIYEDLVESIPGKGTFVKKFTQKDASDLMDIRCILECHSIKLAAELRREEDLEELDYIISKTELIYNTRNNDRSKFLSYDDEFHDKIVQICNNMYMEQQLEIIRNQSRRYLNATTFQREMSLAIEEHRLMFEQIKNQDAAKAEAYMKEHIDNIKKRMIEHINFKWDV